MGFWDWFSRGGRVVRGKANAAMESIEDATFETTLKQTIQDMKGELRGLVDSSADAVANASRLERQQQKLLDQSVDWKKRAKAALQSGREDLARKALAKSKDFDSEADSLRPTVEGAKKISGTLQQRIGQLKSRISEAERNAQTLIARRNAATAQKKVAMALADVGESDDAFSTLARFEENVEKEEAAAIAYDTLASSGNDADLASEIAALETSTNELEVNDDLAALKAELGAEIMRS